MQEADDSFINDYIIEAREHLADIENDLLTIETAGAAIDEKLVNKVFRAAHSIKGGAGFFNLSKIQDLAHRTENVLDLIRAREMAPTPDVINILLMAFDRLRDMINHHSESQRSDINDLVTALTGLVTAHLAPEQKNSLDKMVHISAPGMKTEMVVPEFDYQRAIEGARYLYLVEFDLIANVQRRGKRPAEMLFILSSTGTLVDAVFELEAAGTLDDEPSNRLPFYLLFSSELGPENSEILFDVPLEQVHVIHSPGEPAPAAVAKPAAAVEEIALVKVIENFATPVEDVGIERQAQEEAGRQVGLERQVAEEAGRHVGLPLQEVNSRAAAGVKSEAAVRGEAGEATLRVEVGLLESLMNLAGELVLSRNQLMDAILNNDRRLIEAGAQRISLVTSELQEAIMLTRMQPISNIFNKFPRVVRDLANSLGKEVQLEIEGRDVEMDKTIIEGLSEPLTHMVRNSVDHGIELPGERTRLGKPSAGTLYLKAYHEAGHVVIEVGDDGKGIDPQVIAQSALAKGLISQEQLRGMAEKEMMALIFIPGLSTAKKVSGISGRGVGMDVVKTNLDRLGGEIQIESVPGKGTTFLIKLPLTLAIIPSLLVSVKGERFAIPQVHVSELIHIAADQVKKRIEVIGDAEVLVLRGSLIPLVRLAGVLGIERMFLDPQTGSAQTDRRQRIADRRSPHYTLEEEPGSKEDRRVGDRRRDSDRRFHAASDLNIVIISSGALRFGLIVDELHDTIEIVVKPLGRHLKGLREYAGATILGDGHVALILDSAGIAAKQALVSMAGSRRAKELAQEARRDEAQNLMAYLTFRNTPEEYCAAPLDLVARVSQVRNEQIETIGGRRTMQYRGTSLPLVTLSDVTGAPDLSPEQEKAVIVFQIYGREVGLLAGMPVDVIETTAALNRETLRQTGVSGSTILHGKTTLLLDIHELVGAAHPDWGVEEQAAPEAGVGRGSTVVLLAEDSEFFRGQVKRSLEGAGYAVLAAENGRAGLELLKANAEKVSVVLTDIEMPEMDGLAFTRAIRADGRFGALPVIALSSLASEEDIARARAAGVNGYQIKLDSDSLLEEVRRHLNLARASA